jgi:hypothetical protein
MSVRCSGGVHRRRRKVGARRACAQKPGRDRLGLAAWLGLSLALATGAQGVRAQDAEGAAEGTPPTAAESTLPTAAVLTTTGAAKGDAGLDSLIHASLEKLGVVNITAKPGMDLGAIQIAIDCVGETPVCLRGVATQSGVQILVAPAIERSAEELVLTLLYFDARGDGELRRVARRQSGHELKPETLDAVPDMLRELFQVAAPAPAPGAAPMDETGEGPRTGRRVPIGPLIVGGAGVLIVVGGIVSGVLMEGTQTDFTNLEVTNETQNQALKKLGSKGKDQALVANVLFGVGAAAIAAGAIWLAVELTHGDQESPQQTAVVPVLGPGRMGLALVHRGGPL